MGDDDPSKRPFFPGYLFVRLDCTEDRWSSVHSTRGVRRIVSFGGYPLPVDDGIIVEIRARLAHSAEEPYLEPGPKRFRAASARPLRRCARYRSATWWQSDSTTC